EPVGAGQADGEVATGFIGRRQACHPPARRGFSTKRGLWHLLYRTPRLERHCAAQPARRGHYFTSILHAPRPAPTVPVAHCRHAPSRGPWTPGSICGISARSTHARDATSRDMDMAKLLGVVSLLVPLAFVLWSGYQQWVAVVVEMPAWGWAAIILGGGLSLIV